MRLDQLIGMRPVSIIVFIALMFPGISFGLDNTLVPSIGVKEEYNDNVLFDRTDEKDDFITTIHPRLGLNYDSEITNIDTMIEAFLNYYATETDLNDQNYRGVLGLDSQFLERWRFEARGEYLRDTTLESQLLETGRVFERDDRDQFSGQLTGGIKITELTSFRVTYRYKQVEYESDENVNFNEDTITVRFGRRLKNQIDFLNVFGAYNYNESSQREIDTYNVGLGWERELSDIYRIKVSGGYRTSTKLDRQREEENSDGLTFDIDLFRKGELYDASIGYQRGLTNAASGEYLEFDRIILGVRRNLTERSRIGVSGRIVLSRDDSDIATDNSRFFQVEPRYSYKLTQNSSLSLAYRYSQDYDDERDNNKTANRNVIWIELRAAFPQKL